MSDLELQKLLRLTRQLESEFYPDADEMTPDTIGDFIGLVIESQNTNSIKRMNND